MSAGRKVEDGFIIASGDSSEVFEGVEEALPEVVFGIKRRGVVLCSLQSAPKWGSGTNSMKYALQNAEGVVPV